MQFQDILNKYRKLSVSEAEKGRRFEKLIGAYLKTTPLYSYVLKKVWLWSDFPYKKQFSDSGKDVGIDLVAQTTTGEYWAIQCKCVDETTYINKPAVDSFISTSGHPFKDEQGHTRKFSLRLWFSTTNKWSAEAENALKNQDPEVKRQGLRELETAAVDWKSLDQGLAGAKARLARKEIRSHQKEALDRFRSKFKEVDRGKLIMACGTGKTLTALKLAEQQVGKGGLVLFLAPSIALVAQTLKEWMEESSWPLSPICVCSDPQVSRKKLINDQEEADSFSTLDLALPASTDEVKIANQLKTVLDSEGNIGLTVLFSTYQSIDVVQKAQKKIKREFDLIICDEAHRTTGVTLKDEPNAGNFVKVHNQDFIQGRKRVYMTATPRIYRDTAKEKAKELEAILCSMDDETLYGPEVYRLSFAAAVDRQLLTEYKVLILTILESQIPSNLQNDVNNKTKEIRTDDACKLMGCINALSKRMILDDNLLMATDPEPMHRAVAFCQSIKSSLNITKTFNDSKLSYYGSLAQEIRAQLVDIKSEHIDGTMGAYLRDEKLTWLKDAPEDGQECRILTNVRCLSEGVDVPNLDAVIFLSSRNSQIDVVQSVGRVMRKAPGKKYGYIIIPVTITSDGKAEAVLGNHETYKVVWTVLNALRAHDDRFEAEVNTLALNKKIGTKGDTVIISGIINDGSHPHSDGGQNQITLPFAEFEQLQGILYAKMVQKVGQKDYWEKWAKDVAQVAQSYIGRITRLIATPGPHKTAFQEFLSDLRKNINPSVETAEVIEMLAQHLITQPIFESLFENYSFVQNNPVSQALQKMVDILEDQAMKKDTLSLAEFYQSVSNRVSKIKTPEERQAILVELYEKFFKTAFPKVVEKLGIVYTPVEVVDYINHSVAAVLEKEFGRTLADENVHILDPFTGTGTFITRLIQSGLIPPAALARKYERELHANEIVLLAYYIASINIENAYHATQGNKLAYKPFSGICLTDTFQLGEVDKVNSLFAPLLPQNSKRVQAQKKAPIRVIIGNPPYSIGQKAVGDNAKNQSYPNLEKRIANTYVKRLSQAKLSKGVYDTYIKAFRWATDRLDEQNGGLIAFISNGGWLDGNAMDGFRKCLEQEFSSIYVFNLRGNARTQGEQRRKERGNIFGEGSRTPVTITVLVKKLGHNAKAAIYYHDIGDYLTREGKLALIAKKHHTLHTEMKWTPLQPNEHGDWLNKRNDQFENFIPLGDKNDKGNIKTIFIPYYSVGLFTSRDSWIYNSSYNDLSVNIKEMIKVYNSDVDRYIEASKSKKNININTFVTSDEKQISWSSSLKPLVERQIKIKYDDKKIRIGLYRPFYKQFLYLDQIIIERTGQWFNLFPTPEHENLLICATGLGGTKDFSVLMTNVVSDLQLLFNCQCFPLYYYDHPSTQRETLIPSENNQSLRRSGLTDYILKKTQNLYGLKITKEDIFYYVYGILHSPDYRRTFAADLKKILPRLPFVEKTADFWAFSKAGRALADLHLNYEEQPPPSNVKVIGADSDKFQVEKMRFPDNTDKSVIEYNPWVKITNIPLEAYEYVVNGRSAIEWVIERYQVKTDTHSGIKNDPNDWAKEHEKPRYILDLLLSVIRVSLETMKVVNGLPLISF